MNGSVLAAVIAGGASTRFGSPKAFAKVGGERVVDRVLHALRSVCAEEDIVCIANDPVLAAGIGLPSRPDVIAGIGALGGIHAALAWAREREHAGILAVGCDMPFIEPRLLHALLAHTAAVDAVLPASEGPRGVEPLCAWYGIGCVPAIEAAVARGDRRMIGFHDSIRVSVMPLGDVRAYGDPSRMFMNLNAPSDRDLAERLLSTERG